MKIKILFLFIVGMATLYTSNLYAEIKPGAFSLAPNFGSYFFDNDQKILNTKTYGLTAGYDINERWGIEGSFNLLNTKAKIGGAKMDGNIINLDALYYLTTNQRFVPYLAVGAGNLTLDKLDGIDYSGLSGNFGLGLKIFFTDRIAVRIDLRHVVNFPENNVLYTTGLSFAFGGKKKTAPVQAAVAQPQPAAPKDSDGDGVYDDKDQCPSTPAGVKVDSNGCPLDSDKDGVTDDKDQCPNTPAGAKVDSKGCPLDSDKDGVPDYLDQCPNTPAGTKVDSKGCTMDSDGDGVYDDKDQCPNTPKGATVDERGCWVIKDVNFDFAKADIRTVDTNVLDDAVTILKDNPSLKIELQGHTDNKGSAEYNQKLSVKRAQSVMNYMVKKGIEKERLNAIGFGLAKPAASNDTPEGRAENRRVELTPIQ